jgi:hypothetical protein
VAARGGEQMISGTAVWNRTFITYKKVKPSKDGFTFTIKISAVKTRY